MIATVDEMIVQYMPLVHGIANRYARMFRLEAADLVQEGALGLMDAVTRFDPSLSPSIVPLARYTIRRRVQACANKHLAYARRCTIALDASPDKHADPTATYHELVDDPTASSPRELCDARLARALVQQAGAALAQRDRDLIFDHYVRGVSLAELSAKYGRSRAALNDRKRKVLIQMRRTLAYNQSAIRKLRAAALRDRVAELSAPNRKSKIENRKSFP